MAQRIIRALVDLSEQLGIPIVTPEFQILLSLLAAGALAPDDLWQASTLSRSGFFHTLDRLKAWDLIACETDDGDRRRKTYRLRPRTLVMLVRNLALARDPAALVDLLRVWRSRKPCGADEDILTGDPRLPHLTIEFQVLIYLALNPDATAGEIAPAISASATRFHAALRKLGDLGLVERDLCRSDRRNRCYRVAEWVQHAIVETNDKVLAWLDDFEAGTLSRPASRPRAAVTPPPD